MLQEDKSHFAYKNNRNDQEWVYKPGRAKINISANELSCRAESPRANDWKLRSRLADAIQTPGCEKESLRALETRSQRPPTAAARAGTTTSAESIPLRSFRCLPRDRRGHVPYTTRSTCHKTSRNLKQLRLEFYRCTLR